MLGLFRRKQASLRGTSHGCFPSWSQMSAYREPSSGQSFPIAHSHSHSWAYFTRFPGSFTGTFPLCSWWGFLVPSGDSRPAVFDGQEVEARGLRETYYQPLERRIWPPAPLVNKIDSLFWRLMEMILWFLFLLFRGSRRGNQCFGWKIELSEIKGLSALEILESVNMSLAPYKSREETFLSIWRSIYRIRADGDSLLVSRMKSEGLVLMPTL